MYSQFVIWPEFDLCKTISLLLVFAFRLPSYTASEQCIYRRSVSLIASPAQHVSKSFYKIHILSSIPTMKSSALISLAFAALAAAMKKTPVPDAFVSRLSSILIPRPPTDSFHCKIRAFYLRMRTTRGADSLSAMNALPSIPKSPYKYQAPSNITMTKSIL